MLTARITDASGNTIGDGPVFHISSASISNKLDSAGNFNITLPLTDPRNASYLQNDYRVQLYDDNTLIFTGIIRQRQLSPLSHSFVITGPDLLEELRNVTTGINRTFSNTPIGTAVSTLVSLASGWSVASADTISNNLLAKFTGVSALQAIISSAQGLSLHMRQGLVSRTLEIGAFGVNTTAILVNPARVTAELEKNDDIAIIDTLQVVETSNDIANWIIPLGGGRGTSQLNLAKCTRTSPYTVQTKIGPDGRTEYYLSDSASIARSGQREGVFVSEAISPLSNTDADIALAANALYDKAVAYLQRNSIKQVAYRLSCQKLKSTVRPGDKVRLIYMGYVLQDNQQVDYLHIDDYFYVLSVTTRYDANGKVQYELEISNIDKMILDDTEVILNQVQQLQVLRTIPQPTACKSNFVRFEEMDSTHSIKIPINITDATLSLSRCMFTFTTRPLRSTVQGAAAGGDHRHQVGVNNGVQSSGYSQHDFTVAGDVNGGTQFFLEFPASSNNNWYTYGGSGNHTHTSVYGIYDDTLYPQTISIFVDGVDRTSELGGTWAASNATVSVTVDLTTYINNASGGLRQQHTIEIRCASGQGIVETLVELFEIVQAIVVSN